MMGDNRGARASGPHHEAGQRPALHIALLLACVLAGCGGSKEATEAVDRKLDVASRAGTMALENEQPAEAAKQYRAALARAHEIDDIEAIGDSGYNLAVTELRRGNAREAQRVAVSTRKEIERRGRAPFPALLLVEGMAAYRLGDRATAEALADRIVARREEPLVLARGYYLKGLIAADRNDAAAVRAAAAAIGPSKDAAAEADRQELLARAAALAGDGTAGRTAAERAAELRRTTLDYRGMAQALALAGEAAERENRSDRAADLFLRAGRSAMLQNDFRSANTWLARARLNARQAGANDVTTQIDALLRESATRRAAQS
jgi:hypothetical protein